MSSEIIVWEFVRSNVLNYGTLGIWTAYLIYKENQTHKEFLKKLEQLVVEIRKINKK